MSDSESPERVTVINTRTGEVAEFRGSNASVREDGRLNLDRDAYHEKGRVCGRTRHPDGEVVITWLDDGDERVESGAIERLGYTTAHLVVKYEAD